MTPPPAAPLLPPSPLHTHAHRLPGPALSHSVPPAANNLGPKRFGPPLGRAGRDSEGAGNRSSLAAYGLAACRMLEARRVASLRGEASNGVSHRYGGVRGEAPRRWASMQGAGRMRDAGRGGRRGGSRRPARDTHHTARRRGTTSSFGPWRNARARRPGQGVAAARGPGGAAAQRKVRDPPRAPCGAPRAPCDPQRAPCDPPRAPRCRGGGSPTDSDLQARVSTRIPGRGVADSDLMTRISAVFGPGVRVRSPCPGSAGTCSSTSGRSCCGPAGACPRCGPPDWTRIRTRIWTRIRPRIRTRIWTRIWIRMRTRMSLNKRGCDPVTESAGCCCEEEAGFGGSRVCYTAASDSHADRSFLAPLRRF